jgi:hypothetical protein
MVVQSVPKLVSKSQIRYNSRSGVLRVCLHNCIKTIIQNTTNPRGDYGAMRVALVSIVVAQRVTKWGPDIV